jgi:hypothetical protein
MFVLCGYRTRDLLRNTRVFGPLRQSVVINKIFVKSGPINKNKAIANENNRVMWCPGQN